MRKLTEEFEATLLRDGFSADIRAIKLGTANHEHVHPLDEQGLVLGGGVTLTITAGSHTYRRGQIFTMEAGHPHSEWIGPQGLRDMVGRLHKTSADT
ncbi:MAG: cupin [Rhodospirillales bacterium]|jgi:quercetin dioxygenase-like cupin family protein|nr:cupin [Rhodospirillales bacterium]